MGKKKSESTITYQNLQHQGTADEDAYRKKIQNFDFHTPIVNAFGQAEKDINDSVFEEALPEGVGERIKYGRMFDLRQRKGAALSEAAGAEENARAGHMGNLAGMTQNQWAQSGGTNTQSGFFLPALSSGLGGSLGNTLGSA